MEFNTMKVINPTQTLGGKKIGAEVRLSSICKKSSQQISAQRLRNVRVMVSTKIFAPVGSGGAGSDYKAQPQAQLELRFGLSLAIYTYSVLCEI